MNALRSLAVSLVLCSLFASSLVRADDCSDALMAESCACRSEVRSEREQVRSSDKNSPSDPHSKAWKSGRMKIAQRAKMTPPSDNAILAR